LIVQLITAAFFGQWLTDLKGFHLSVIIGIPIIITLGVIIFSRKHFIVLTKIRSL
jgi:hypothetical protein